ncbi:type II toxin-antitoxin system ParD family antitoxin [Botrimarina sp.]|uniref:ribbon-helix-helix domain-containing protein n=1 Tax=Botrimarina sp. TaxID=2795802 RepID=UPI0032EC881A
MIRLTPEQQAFIDEQVSSGRYSNPADVVSAAIELLRASRSREFEGAIADIEQSLEEIDAGHGIPASDVIADARARLAKR